MVSQIKVNEIIKQSGSSITIGESGDTLNLSNPTSVTLNSTMKNTPAFFVQKSSAQSISQNSTTKLTFDTEIYDTDNTFASDKFTPSVAGTTARVLLHLVTFRLLALRKKIVMLL